MSYKSEIIIFTKNNMSRKRFFKLVNTLLLLLVLLPALAQVKQQPIVWRCKLEKDSTETNLYKVIATGSFINEGWYIYGLGPYSKGPTPTTLSIEENDNITLEGENRLLTESKTKFSKVFKMEIDVCEGKVVIEQKIRTINPNETELKAIIEWQSCDINGCLPPEEKEFIFNIAPAHSETSSGSVWGLILQAIAWGFVALLTPCVFPMVPMTVSFFLKQSEGIGKRKGRINAALYGLFIVALYTIPIAVIIGVTYFAGGATITADIFNWLATHWIPNVLFFLIFMIFAASFFGAFDIVIPSRFVNKADSQSDKKGILGIFFMALTLVLVSFSCTGPIVGTVLIKSTQGEIWAPIITMFAFSVAFALPFTIFAFAPSLLKNLPKSGGWLNSVKVVLGFIEVALGFKFLSVADQTYHWGILDREVYLAIWIVTFSLLGFYLLGKIRFKYDDKLEHISVFRLTLAIAVFSFVVYMIPGMWGAPLKGLSGYLPPITTQDFVMNRESGASTLDLGKCPTSAKKTCYPKYSDFLKIPHDIQGFFDYEEGRQYAMKVNKPLFIDFTGHGCVNCREMEMRVWSDPRVLKMMKEDFVVVALYADDKKVVDKEDWVVTEDGRTLKTLGKINSHFAVQKFNVNAQPYYAIINPFTQEHIVPSQGYNLDVENFLQFLRKGKN